MIYIFAISFSLSHTFFVSVTSIHSVLSLRIRLLVRKMINVTSFLHIPFTTTSLWKTCLQIMLQKRINYRSRWINFYQQHINLKKKHTHTHVLYIWNMRFYPTTVVAAFICPRNECVFWFTPMYTASRHWLKLERSLRAVDSAVQIKGERLQQILLQDRPQF